jgi:hypothetical protein
MKMEFTLKTYCIYQYIIHIRSYKYGRINPDDWSSCSILEIITLTKHWINSLKNWINSPLIEMLKQFVQLLIKTIHFHTKKVSEFQLFRPYRNCKVTWRPQNLEFPEYFTVTTIDTSILIIIKKSNLKVKGSNLAKQNHGNNLRYWN